MSVFAMEPANINSPLFEMGGLTARGRGPLGLTNQIDALHMDCPTFARGYGRAGTARGRGPLGLTNQIDALLGALVWSRCTQWSRRI